jgi:hypothetical protein
MLYTTVNLLKANKAYPERHMELSYYGPDEPIPLSEILEIFGLEDALRTLWMTTTPNEAKRFAGLLACDYVEHILPTFENLHGIGISVTSGVVDDNYLAWLGQWRSWPRRAIETARQFLRGETTRDAVVAAAGDIDELVFLLDISTESEPKHSPICTARDIADATANAVRAALGRREYSNILNIVRNTPENEREWQTRHFSEMLETFDKGGEQNE